MAIARPVGTDEAQNDRLLDQARRYDEQAEEHRVRARELSQLAGELRAEVEASRRPPLAMLLAPKDERIQMRTLQLLEEWGRCTTPQIATHLHVADTRVRAALTVLKEQGQVARVGVGAGTMWMLPAEAADLPTQNSSAIAMIRDAARTLDCFNYEELKSEVAVLSDSTLRRYLPQLVSEGVLEEARMEGSLVKVYAYSHPESSSPARAKQAPPEQIVREQARRGAVSGTGKGQRAGGALVNALLREIRQFPQIEVVKTAHSYTFRREGKTIASCSRTPGASSLSGTRKQLRNAGVPVAS